MSQIRENGTPLFWLEVTFDWYEGAIVFFVFIFIFCLETTVLEINWMRTTSVAVMVIIFSKVSFRNSKFISNNYEAPGQRQIKDTLQMKILRTWINIGVEPGPINLAYYCMLFFLSTNLVSKFNLILIEKFLAQFIYLSTFRYSVNLEVHPVSTLFS